MLVNFRGASNLLLSSVFGVLVISCSGNVLTELSNQNTDAALFEEAKKQLDKANYTAAIEACVDMSVTATDDRDTAFICASAYSGRCGLDFLGLITSVTSYSGTPNLLEFMMERNDSATPVDVSDCTAATTLIQSIGEASDRTTDENLFMFFNNLQTLGVVANLFADLDNNDDIDPAYNTCADIDDANADHIAEALWEMEASAASTGVVALQAFGTAIEAMCNDPGVGIQSVDPAANFCAAADTDSFTIDHLRGARAIFREDVISFGLNGAGDCAGNPVAACICP